MPKRILLADDSLTIQKVVELTFMEEDYEVTAVGNGDLAIASLGEQRPDLVIADVHMPGAGGYEVCRRAKELHPELPVLLLVGTFEAFQESEAAACGADGHLKKPFDSQELLRRVEGLLAAVPAAGPTEGEGALSDAGFELAADTGMAAAEAPAQDEEPSAFELGDEPELAESPAPAMDIERSPWEDEANVAPVDVERAAGLMNVETLGAPARDIDIRALETPDAEPAPVEIPTPAAETSALSDADIDRIARRVVELMGDRLLREVAWEVVPDLAEVVIKDRIRELERQLE